MAWTDGTCVVGVQWMLDPDVPVGWAWYVLDSMSAVRSLPKDDIVAVNIHGVVLQADHIGFTVDSDTGALVAGKWNDDEDDWPPFDGSGFGWLYSFDAMPDGYPIDTCVRYADPARLQAALDYDVANGTDDYAWCQSWLDDPTVRPWSEWPRFLSNATIHGVWLTDAQFAAYTAARENVGYDDPRWQP